MNEGVVEGGVDVSDTENELALSNLGTESDRLLLGDLDLLGGLHPNFHQFIHPNNTTFPSQNIDCCILYASWTLTMMF